MVCYYYDMKKYVRVFRHKEDGIPVNSFEMIKKGLPQHNNSIFDDAKTVYGVINTWMDQTPNGKVDFVWLH